MAVSIWFNKDCTGEMCNKFFNQIFQPEGFDISIWRKSASRLQAAAQPYRVSPVIGQPGSPCKTAVEPTFCGRKFLVLAIWLRDLFFFGFHPNILYFFLRGLTFGDFVQNFCAARMSLEAAKRLCIFFEQTKKDKKTVVIPPLFGHPSWRSEACRGH